MSKLREYFTLYSTSQYDEIPEDRSSKRPNAGFQYAALLFGVLVQPFFSTYKEHGKIIWKATYQNIEFLGFAAIVALIIFPGIYKSTFDTRTPKFVQMIPIFIAGLGWQSIVDSVITGISKDAGAVISWLIQQTALQIVSLG